jgi:hypothetical protein
VFKEQETHFSIAEHITSGIHIHWLLIFKVYISLKGITNVHISVKQFVSQNRINGCDCWGPDDSLDTKIDDIDSCHILMSYASYDIKCHIMTNGAYDIEI